MLRAADPVGSMFCVPAKTAKVIPFTAA